MNIFMTSGTFDFLYKMKEKHPNETMILMQNIDHALLLHETDSATVFKTPRSYQVLNSFRPLEKSGYVVMHNIPVIEEERPLFEYRFKNKQDLFEKLNGLIALRVLRPLKSDTYVVLTLWKNEKFFKEWEGSVSYEMLFSETNSTSNQAKLFFGSSYVSKYFIPEDSQ